MQAIGRTSTSAIIELVEAFDFKKVEKVMIATDWKWAFTEESRIPTIEEMRDKCLCLLFTANSEKTTTSSGGFQALRKIDNNGREVFELRFIATWNYSHV